MVAEEEFAAVQRLRQKQREREESERYVCLVAVSPAQELVMACPEELRAGSGTAVVGTLDLMAVRAVPGEVLIGGFWPEPVPGHACPLYVYIPSRSLGTARFSGGVQPLICSVSSLALFCSANLRTLVCSASAQPLVCSCAVQPLICSANSQPHFW
jgi:hypothetical protein